jgi:hypothetical protein
MGCSAARSRWKCAGCQHGAVSLIFAERTSGPTTTQPSSDPDPAPSTPAPHVLPRSTPPPRVGVAACMDNRLRTDTCGDPTDRARLDRCCAGSSAGDGEGGWFHEGGGGPIPTYRGAAVAESKRYHGTRTGPSASGAAVGAVGRGRRRPEGRATTGSGASSGAGRSPRKRRPAIQTMIAAQPARVKRDLPWVLEDPGGLWRCG